MPQQAVAKREGVALVVGRGFVLLDHLRLDRRPSRPARAACRRSCSRGCGRCRPWSRSDRGFSDPNASRRARWSGQEPALPQPQGRRYRSAARIAFLNTFIPSSPLSSQRPNAYCSGPCPISHRTIGIDIQLHNTFDPDDTGDAGAQAEIRYSPPDRSCRGRLAPAAGWIAVPVQLRQRASSKSTIKNDARITVAPDLAPRRSERAMFSFTNSPPVLLVKGPHRTQNIPAQPGGPTHESCQPSL